MTVEAISTNLTSQDSAHAKRHRKLLDLMIAIGIENVISVPKVVVVGSQSAGKSSILEALSGITFPRASGTCSRCPSEVRLFYSKTASWVCEVSLRFEKDVEGSRLDKVSEYCFGEPITDASKVQHRLRQAQKAILNPSKPPESFLQEEETINSSSDTDGDVKAVDEVQFSENVICIKVTGCTVRDLSVVDLPGLIANVGENEDKRNIQLIQNLAKKEIAKEDCIILSCIPMTDDFQNQLSVTLVKDADPKGLRTLGVLTKPDRMEIETFEKNWKTVIEGTEHKLLHGYYVVKNPKPAEMGKLTWKEARDEERAFFQTDPWAKLGSKYTSRLGSDNLAAKLAALLEQIIKEKMPSIVAKVKEKDVLVKKEMASLPKEMPEGQLLFHLSSLIRAFEKDWKYELLESQEDNSLADDVFRISLDFWADLINHRPRFLPLTESELNILQKITKSLNNVYGLKKVKEMRDYVFADDIAELKTRGIIEQEGYGEEDKKTLVPLLIITSEKALLYGSSSLNIRLVDSRLLLNLSEVSKIKARATQDLLPNNTPWSVKKRIIELCLKCWPTITTLTIESIQARILKESKKLITKHFSRFQVGGLENLVSKIMEKLIDELVKKTKTFLDDLVKLESRYTTVNTHEFLTKQMKVKEAFVEAREGCNLVIFGKNEKLPDNVDEELTLVSEILVYWQIACKRYTDNVRSAFFAILLEPIANNCLDVLTRELGIFNEDGVSLAKSLLQEDQDTVQKRNGLLKEQRTLSECLKVIDAFWSGSLNLDE